jgi:hypothetical protein
VSPGPEGRTGVSPAVVGAACPYRPADTDIGEERDLTDWLPLLPEFVTILPGHSPRGLREEGRRRGSDDGLGLCRFQLPRMCLWTSSKQLYLVPRVLNARSGAYWDDD